METPGASKFSVRTGNISLHNNLQYERESCFDVRETLFENFQNTLSDVTPKIINISSYDLSNAEISLLSKGMKFCPTSISKNLLELRVDILAFLRKIQLLDM